MRALRLLAATGLALAGLVLIPSSAFACDCAPRTTAEYVAGADVVVRGTVESIELPPEKEVMSSGDPVTYTIDVAAAYKGQVGATVEVRSAVSGASCGLEGIKTGREYVVFAAEDNPVGTGAGLWGNLCGGTGSATPGLVAEVESATAGTDPPVAPTGAAGGQADAGQTDAGAMAAEETDGSSRWPWVAGGVVLLAGGVVLGRRLIR